MESEKYAVGVWGRQNWLRIALLATGRDNFLELDVDETMLLKLTLNK
jgi:hypothetical protein